MDVRTGGAKVAIHGRDDELLRLSEVVDASCRDGRQVAVVCGELGIGKSTLATEVLRRTDAQMLVGGCLPAEGDAMPFAPVTASLRCLLRSLTADVAADLVARWPRAFLDFVPYEFIGNRADDMQGSDDAQLSSSGQSRLFEWLLTVVCQLAAERPVIWLIEDVHWADRSTMDLIGYLARNLNMEAVVLLLTLRTDEIDRDHPARRWLSELERLDAVTRVNLGRLSRQATEGQLRDLTEGSQVVLPRGRADLIFEHSEGNPLFTSELVAWAEADARQWPETLYALVASRLDALPGETRMVLDAAAVLGRTYSLKLLAEVLDLDERTVENALGPAVERHLVEPHTSDDYAFAGPLIQQVLEADLRPGARRHLHQAAVRAKSTLLAEGSDSQFELVAQIAHHWDVAQVEQKAFVATVQAGLSAARLYALVEADQYFARAVGMPCSDQPDAYAELELDRLDLLLHASQAAHLVGDGVRAVAWIDEATQLTDDPIRIASLLERKGAYCFNTGRVDEANAAYRRALALLPDKPSPLRARILGGLGLLAMAWSRMTECEELCHEAIRDARAVGARQAEVRALNALGMVMSYRGELDQGILHSREAVAIAEELDSPDDMATAYIDLAHVLDLAGRFGEAVEVCRVGYDAMARVGLARQDGSFLLANAAESLIKSGHWSEAADLLGKANASNAQGLRSFPVRAHEARLRMRMGDLARAEECVESARRLFAEYDAPDAWRREFHEVAAELLIWLGRPEESLDEARAGLALAEGSDEERMAGPLILTALQSLAGLIEAARARHDLAAVEGLIAQAGQLKARGQAAEVVEPDSESLPRPLPESAGIALTIDAEFARCRGTESTADRWAAVAQKWTELGQPFGTVYANWREAESLVMSREVGQRPVAAVRRAYEGARLLGAGSLVAEVENLARWGRIDLVPSAVVEAVGGTAQDEFGLTQREQEVLSGLLAGQTNREIAESLFISTKTSSVHVSNILRKLGVKSREEAARVAHRQMLRN